MSLQNKYKNFADKIALTRESDKYKDGREKDDMITPKVVAAFKEAGYIVDSNFMQGSLKSHTGVIPLNGDDYDIDRAIAITEDSSPNNPIEPKKIVKRVLSEHGFSEPKIKRPCVTADYKSKPLHIDFPIYRVDSDGDYQLAVGKENSDEDNHSWDDSDPKGLNDWITSGGNHQGGWLADDLTSAERSQFYRIVRYLKRWRDFKYTSEEQRKKIYSIALTIMLKKSFCPCVDDEGIPDDHTALKDTLTVLLEDDNYFTEKWNGSIDLEVHLPVTPKSDVFKGRGDSIAEVLRNRLQKLLDVLHDVDEEDFEKEQCKILRKQFGDDFPDGNNNGNKNNSRATTKTAGLVGVSSGA